MKLNCDYFANKNFIYFTGKEGKRGIITFAPPF